MNNRIDSESIAVIVVRALHLYFEPVFNFFRSRLSQLGEGDSKVRVSFGGPPRRFMAHRVRIETLLTPTEKLTQALGKLNDLQSEAARSKALLSVEAKARRKKSVVVTRWKVKKTSQGIASDARDDVTRKPREAAS
jgi:hypothetical protein